MQIQLTDTDLEKMPYTLRSELLIWLGHKGLKSAISQNRKVFSGSQSASSQLTLAVEVPSQISKDQAPATTTMKLVEPASGSSSQRKLDQQTLSHVRLTQLFDAGITKPGMRLRVRLFRELEKQLGRGYAIPELTISSKGTVFYQEEEFDKPSPLAKQVIGRSVNGWEYVEVQKNGQWICLNELREIWRSAS